MQRLIQMLARGTALAGGLVLILLVLLTTVSILGRSINKLLHSAFFQQNLTDFSQWMLASGVDGINGSYELLEAGIAFSIFSFLPVTQLYGTHATVDVFTSFLPKRLNLWLIAFWEIILTLVIVLIIWRLYEGMLRYLGNGETTLFLQFPVWWAYAASLAAGLVACITAVYCTAMRIAEAASGNAILPSEYGEH